MDNGKNEKGTVSFSNLKIFEPFFANHWCIGYIQNLRVLLFGIWVERVTLSAGLTLFGIWVERVTLSAGLTC